MIMTWLELGAYLNVLLDAIYVATVTIVLRFLYFSAYYARNFCIARAMGKNKTIELPYVYGINAVTD